VSVAANGLDQLHGYLGNTEEQRHSLFHVRPARAPVTILRHHESLLPLPGRAILPGPAGVFPWREPERRSGTCIGSCSALELPVPVMAWLRHLRRLYPR
jgi:hypothetical protein